MTKFRSISRGSWEAKRPGKHRGVITRTAESVFEALMFLASKYSIGCSRASKASAEAASSPLSPRSPILNGSASSPATGASGG